MGRYSSSRKIMESERANLLDVAHGAVRNEPNRPLALRRLHEHDGRQHRDGDGQNNTSSMCNTSSTEIGDGGSGGALYMDGGHDGDTTLCGVVMSNNHANALGGAIFRVFDDATHNFNVDVSTFDSNVADGPVGVDGDGPGAGAFYFHNCDLNISDSTISNNSSPGCGALQADTTLLDLTNDTFSGNTATDGIGGAICIFSGVTSATSGTLTNCTLANNQALAADGRRRQHVFQLLRRGDLRRQHHREQHDHRERHDRRTTSGRMTCPGRPGERE